MNELTLVTLQPFGAKAAATLGWRLGAALHPGRVEVAALRAAPTMNAQEVGKTLLALVTLGWQAGERSMRCALEAAAVRMARTMNAQNAVNTLLTCHEGSLRLLFSNGGALDQLCDGDLEFLLFCKPLAQGDRVVSQRKPFM